jgi:hypothetical protein
LDSLPFIPRDLPGLTFACRRIDDLVIVVHEMNVAPSDTEWERYVSWCTLSSKAFRPIKLLVIAGNQAPTSKQRSLYNEIGAESVRRRGDAIARAACGRESLFLVHQARHGIRQERHRTRSRLSGNGADSRRHGLDPAAPLVDERCKERVTGEW